MNNQRKKQLDAYQNGLLSEQNELVVAYMPALRAMAARLKSRLPACVEFNDLVGAGVCAMVSLSRAYDKEKNDNFWGYARMRVYGAMLDFLRSLDPMSRGDRKLIKQINELSAQYFNEHESEPSDEWLAKKIGVSAAQISDAKNMSEIAMLLPLDEQYDLLANPEGTFEKVEKDDLISHIMEILRGFSLKDQQVIQLYYFDELNLAEISELLGISQSRVCQIHKKMIIKLRERLGF